MRFLIDEQLPPALAVWLTDHGHQAEHVYRAGLLGLSDYEIARHALETGAVLLTKDEDFTALRSELELKQLVWIRLGNLSNRKLLAQVELAWQAVIALLQAGKTLVVVLPEGVVL